MINVSADKIHALDAVNAGVVSAVERLNTVASAYQRLRYDGMMDDLSDRDVQVWLRGELQQARERLDYALQRWDGAFN